MKEAIFRNTCPRNCYGTCSMLSYVKDEILVKVTGDPKHGFNQGRLCAKGYAYTQFVYSPHRLKYPMLQKPRGSGNWKRITWDEAFSIIAYKIIQLNMKYGSNLACAYNKFSGNLGLLHYAVEGMFNSIGPHTRIAGNPCATSGIQAFEESLGQEYSSNPEDMSEAKLIVIWGANPAVTNVHQMKFLYEARQNGATLVCIDPIFTRTAEKADLFIQINPGTDLFLSIGIAKLLIDWEKYDNGFIQEKTVGWKEFKDAVGQINLEDICRITGVSMEAMLALATLYAKSKPAVTWCGLGIQRNKNGRQSISAINSLAALTSSLSSSIGGIYYLYHHNKEFPLKLINHKGPDHPSIKNCRELYINNFASDALALDNPPIKFLWVASRNPLTQDQDLKEWKKLLEQLDLIVTVDLFLTKTAEQSDLVLPASTHFEEEDLNVGYWHHWLSYNQKAIPPYYEAKSDLQIARELTRKLNELSPGFSNFPSDKEPLDWIREELTEDIRIKYGISDYQDLLKGPHDKILVSPPLSGEQKFQFVSLKELSFTDTESLNQSEAYRLLSPQSLLKIHSQFEQISWFHHNQGETVIEIPSEIAQKYLIQDDSKVEIYNEFGSIMGIAKVNPSLPSNVLLADQAGSNPVNQLIRLHQDSSADGSSGFFYDSMVKIRKWRNSNV
ncbi:molybdopterin-dependent oxidoreductase [Brevibacillus ginsengisoli]|uniref:molybdopterin-dependent oxidoreductase n=1 Tax=Brevibacillus ginsengisoli TaxID=363854 RepID=UPI003CFA7916